METRAFRALPPPPPRLIREQSNAFGGQMGAQAVLLGSEMNITRPFLSRFSPCLRSLARLALGPVVTPSLHGRSARTLTREQNGGGGTERDEAATEMDEKFRSQRARSVTSRAFVYGTE